MIKNKIKLFVLNIIAICFFSGVVLGEGVRGRLDGMGTYGPYPVVGIPVTAFSVQYGTSNPSYSDNQGMFYIYGLRPGPHTLQIWLGGFQPMIFYIRVFPNQPLTDIAPIRVM